MSEGVSGTRKDWLDALRAVPVLFVIFGHYYTESTPFYVFTSPIKLPLLFAISGYLFNTREETLKDFLLGLFRKLIFPWIALTWVPEILASLLRLTDSTVSEVLYSAISGYHFWYFPCLIVAEIVFFFIVSYGKKTITICGYSFLIGGLGYYLSSVDVLTFGMVNRALTVQPFLLLGYLLRSNWMFFKKISVCGLVITYLALCIASLWFFPGQNMDVHLNRYYHLPLCIILVVTGCISAFLLAERITVYPGFLKYLGKNTLILWTMNGYCLFVWTRVLWYFGISIQNTLLEAIIKLVYVCVACSLIAFFINRYIPEIAGKKRRFVDKGGKT